MRGETVITLRNIPRTLKFGGISCKELEKVFEMKLSEIFDRMADDKGQGFFIDAFGKILYVGLLGRKSKNNLPVGFDLEMCFDWIEEEATKNDITALRDETFKCFGEGMLIVMEMLLPKQTGESMPAES